FDAADGEIDRLRRDVSGETADQLERSVRRILAKVMHQPAERARRLAETGFADEYVSAFHTIFGIDISAPQLAEAEALASPPGPPGTPAEPVPAGWMRVDRTVPPGAEALAGLE